MDRPKKFKYIVSTPNKKEDRFKFHEDCGYNRAIDDYDKWLEESASVEKIEKIVEKELDCGLDDIIHYAICTDIAKEISKSIIGK